MRPPSKPAINKNNPTEWFIYWNHDLPLELWDAYHPRKRIRIRLTDYINQYTVKSAKLMLKIGERFFRHLYNTTISKIVGSFNVLSFFRSQK